MAATSADDILAKLKRQGDGIQALKAEWNDALSGSQELWPGTAETTVFTVPGRTALDIYLRALENSIAPGDPSVLAGCIVRAYAVVQGQEYLLGAVVFGSHQRAFEGVIARVRCGANAIKVTLQGGYKALELLRDKVTLSVYAYGTDPQATEFADLTVGDRSDPANLTSSSLGAALSYYPPVVDEVRTVGSSFVSEDSIRQLFGTNTGTDPVNIIVAGGTDSDYADATFRVYAVLGCDPDKNFSLDLREVAPTSRRKDGVLATADYPYLFVIVTIDLHPDGSGNLVWTRKANNGVIATVEVR